MTIWGHLPAMLQLRFTSARFALALALALWPAMPELGRIEDASDSAHFSFSLPAPGGLELAERIEHFLLERPADELEPSERQAPPAPAFAEWRSSLTAKGWHLELVVHFPAEGIRVYAVECLTEHGPRLVWREVCPRAGRTLLADWTEGGERLRAREWAADGSLRESCDASRGAVLPLYLVELLRSGQLSQGAQLVFDPLGRALERQSIRTSYAKEVTNEGRSAFARVVELAREDESLAARYVFQGAELVRFQWQEGGWIARRIDGEEYLRRLADSEERRMLRESAAAAVKDP